MHSSNIKRYIVNISYLGKYVVTNFMMINDVYTDKVFSIEFTTEDKAIGDNSASKTTRRPSGQQTEHVRVGLSAVCSDHL